jgi:hypothetical protein
MTHQEAVATVVAAFNDPDRTQIGDPREGKYHIGVQFTNLKDAFDLARRLARLGIIPRTTVLHDDMFGEPVVALVNIYGKEDQRKLLDGLRSKLNELQLERFERLVLARGPIPEDIIERMVKARALGWKVSKIAEKMNEQGIITGMGKRWTPTKVKNALAEYDKKHGPWSGAVEPGTE